MGNHQSGKTIEKTNQNTKKKIRLTKILKRFEMCPAGYKSENLNNIDEADSPQRPERKIYHVNAEESSQIAHIKNRNSEWVDVPLDVPESPRYITPIMSQAETPKVPPRKHLKKKKQAIETSASPTNEYYNKIPVEEPIIIAKKEPVHICDGKHHHVANVCEKTNCDTNKKNLDKNSTENSPQIKKLKTLSVVSLPDYNEFQLQPPKNDNKKTKTQTNANKSRHISVPSFPVEGKISFSAATAERLESYITRCKSFGSLRPQQVIEKLKNQEMKDESDSDDSWDGLDDWDLGVVEQEYNITSKMSPYRPHSVVKNQNTNDYHNGPKAPSLSLNMPKCILETDEQSNSPLPKGQELPTLRRESIDDFFTNKYQPDSMNAQEVDELIKNSRIGRRGSDVIHGYDMKSYPFKPHKTDHTFKSDSFFSSALIETESHVNNPHFPFKNTTVTEEHNQLKSSVDVNIPKAARRRSGSVNTDEVINHLQNINRDINDKIQEGQKDTKETGLKKDSTREANDHSNLYKIINDNSVLETTYHSPYNSSNVSFDSKLIVSQIDNIPRESSETKNERLEHKMNQREAKYKFMTGEEMPKDDSINIALPK